MSREDGGSFTSQPVHEINRSGVGLEFQMNSGATGKEKFASKPAERRWACTRSEGFRMANVVHGKSKGEEAKAVQGTLCKYGLGRTMLLRVFSLRSVESRPVACFLWQPSSANANVLDSVDFSRPGGGLFFQVHMFNPCLSPLSAGTRNANDFGSK